MNKVLLGAAVAAILPTAVMANPINVETGTFGGGVEGNLEFNSCTDPRPDPINDGVVGCVNAGPTNYVYVYGDEAIQYDGGGQAYITDVAGNGYTSLTIDFLDDDVAFALLTVNIIGVKKSGGGKVDFGNGFVFDIDDNGENKFTIEFAPGVNSYTFSTTEGIWAEIKQVRFKFEDGDTTDVPEPAMLGLFGLGLMGLGMARRRRG